MLKTIREEVLEMGVAEGSIYRYIAAFNHSRDKSYKGWITTGKYCEGLVLIGVDNNEVG